MAKNWLAWPLTRGKSPLYREGSGVGDETGESCDWQ